MTLPAELESASLLEMLEIFEDIGRSFNLDPTADAILRGLSVVIQADHFRAVVVDRRGKIVSDRKSQAQDTLDGSVNPVVGKGAIGSILADGHPVLHSEVEETSDRRDLLTSTRSAVAVPVLGGAGRVVGVLLVEANQSMRFDKGSVRTLSQYAAAVAPSLERALFYQRLSEERRLEGEMEIARKVMRGVLPRSEPKLDGLDIAARIEPYHEVGGDYYDFIPLGNDRWGLAMADVTGKGIAAALMVAAMRASLYSHAKNELALRAIFQRTNEFLYESAGVNAKYVTLTYAVLDVQARRLIYINAGHLPPIVLRTSGEIELLRSGGFPLGMFDNPRYFERFLQLETGDLLVLYTDGITERTNSEEEDYGRDRLVAKIAEMRRESADVICESVLKDVQVYSNSVRNDDATLLIVKAT